MSPFEGRELGARKNEHSANIVEFVEQRFPRRRGSARPFQYRVNYVTKREPRSGNGGECNRRGDND